MSFRERGSDLQNQLQVLCDGLALVSVGAVLCMERILLFFRLPQFFTPHGDRFRLPLCTAAEAHE